MMEFVVFVWLTASLLYLSIGLLTFIGQYIVVVSFIKNNLLYLIGLLFLSIGLWLYIPYTQELWIVANNMLYPYIQENAGQYQYLFMEVWYTVVFFRNMWPAVLTALTVVAVENIQYPVSSRYRMLKQFSHNKLLVMVGALFAYFIVHIMNDTYILTTFFLCIAVYTAVFYWRFGVSVILYILKKSNIPYEIGLLFLIATVIISGEFFLLPLIMCIGIGISDIWMDYYRRNAASSVFSFEFH